MTDFTLPSRVTASYNGVSWDATIGGSNAISTTYNNTYNIGVSGIAASTLNGALSGGEASFVADDGDLNYPYAILSSGTTAGEIVEITNVSGTTYTAAVVSAHTDGLAIIFLDQAEIKPEWFGATGTNDDTAFDAIVVAVNLLDGLTIVLDANQTYDDLASYSFTKSFTIIGNGSTLSADGTGMLFTLTGTRGTDYAIDSNADKGDSRVEDAAIAGSISSGDLVLITHSEDSSPNDAGESIDYGEIHRCVGVSGDYILLNHGLHHSYTTANSATIAKLTAPTATIRDLKIEQTYSDTAGGIRLIYCDSSHIENVRIDKAKDRAFDFAACYRPALLNCEASRSDKSTTGYGVSLQAMYPLIDGCLFTSCRHGLTTGGAPAYDMVTWGAVVSNCIASGSPSNNTHPSFDTHATFSEITFINCIAINAQEDHAGAGTNLAGWVLEGGDVSIISCQAVNCGAAISLFGQDLHRVYIADFQAINCDSGVNLNGAEVDELIIDGLYAERDAEEDQQAIVVAGSSVVNEMFRISNIHVRNMQLIKVGGTSTLPNDVWIDGFSFIYDSKQATIDAIEIENATPTSWRFMNGRIEHPRYGIDVGTAIDNLEFINVIFEDTSQPIFFDVNIKRILLNNCSFGTQANNNTVAGAAVNLDALIITNCVATATITNISNITGTFGVAHHSGNEWAGNITTLFNTAPTLEILAGDEISGGVHRGSGAPSHSAVKGTIYQRTDGATNTLLYVNDDGSTSWAAYA